MTSPFPSDRREFLRAASAAGFTAASAVATAQDDTSARLRAMVIESTMHPFEGEFPQAVEYDSLRGTVACGYQGWYCCHGDDMHLGWSHYQTPNGKFEPGHCEIEMWPDLSEFDADEKFATAFRHSDGSAAQLFSSCNPKTVRRHFQWMKDHGIDGAILNRFPVDLKWPEHLARKNVSLNNVRYAANMHGRFYALSYDLSLMKPDAIVPTIKEDWPLLVEAMGISRNPRDRAYLRHKGRPVVGLWGVGFLEHDEGFDAWAEAIEFLKRDRVFGKNTLLLGVPTYWRTMDRDARPDKRLLELCEQADVLWPWTPGRMATFPEVASHGATIRGDLKWCEERGIDYLPVVSPGYSDQNRARAGGKDSTFNRIQRNGGSYLWRQATAAKRAGCDMAYVAMFDEMNEGTAILKCTNDPPQGGSRFLTFEGLPSDHYLWLSGEVGKLMRATKPPTHDALPARRARS